MYPQADSSSKMRLNLAARIQKAYREFSIKRTYKFIRFAALLYCSFGIIWLIHIIPEEYAEAAYIKHGWIISTILAIYAIKYNDSRKASGIILCVSIILIIIFYYAPYAQCIKTNDFSISFIINTISIYTISIITTKIVDAYFRTKRVDEKLDTDKLSRQRMYNKIHACIRSETSTTGHAYAIYGKWGSGKTHLLKHMAERLQKRYKREQYDDPDENEACIYKGQYNVCWVALWQFHSTEEATTAIARSLQEALGCDSRNEITSKTLSILRIANRILNTAEEEIYDAIASLIIKQDNDKKKNEIETINRYLEIKEERAILFIEDFERADTSLIEHLLPLFETLAKIKHLTICCSIDFEQLEKKTMRSPIIAGSLQGYLDKVFDLSFDIPELECSIASRYFLDYVKENHKHCTILLDFAKDYSLHFGTPRQVQRVANHLASIDWMYLEEREKSNAEVSLGEYSPKYIFLCETMKCIYKDAYHYLKHGDIIDKIESIKGNEKDKPLPPDNFIDTLRERYNSDFLFKDLIRLFPSNSEIFSIESVTYAFQEKYKRRIVATEYESEKILNNCHTTNSPLITCIDRFYGLNKPEDTYMTYQRILSYAYNSYRHILLRKEQPKKPDFTYIEVLIREANGMAPSYEKGKFTDYITHYSTDNPISFSGLETIFCDIVGFTNDAKYIELFHSLSGILPLNDLNVLLGRMHYTTTEDFKPSEHDIHDSFTVMFKQKETDCYIKLKKAVIEMFSNRLVHYLLLLSQNQNMNDGFHPLLNGCYIIDEVNDSEELDLYVRSTANAIAKYHQKQHLDICIGALIFMQHKFTFPEQNAVPCFVSDNMLAVFEPIFGMLSLPSFIEPHTVLILQHTSNTISSLNQSLKRYGSRSYFDKFNYRTGTTKAINKLKNIYS